MWGVSGVCAWQVADSCMAHASSLKSSAVPGCGTVGGLCFLTGAAAATNVAVELFSVWFCSPQGFVMGGLVCSLPECGMATVSAGISLCSVACACLHGAPHAHHKFHHNQRQYNSKRAHHSQPIQPAQGHLTPGNMRCPAIRLRPQPKTAMLRPL